MTKTASPAMRSASNFVDDGEESLRYSVPVSLRLKNKATKYLVEVLLGLAAFVILQYFFFGEGVESELEAPAEPTEAVVDATATPTTSAAELERKIASSTSAAELDSPTEPVASTSATEAPVPPPTGELVPVMSVVDGDTIKVSIAGKTETLRIVGINTPETVDPRKPVECFGREASDRMKALVAGKSVRLERDETQGDRDRYNRLLRFVFLEDGRDVGLELIREGFAEESLYGKTPHRYREEYVEAEREAQSASRGLWDTTLCPNN